MRVNIIGTGIAGMTAGALLAEAGFETHLYERNEDIGGVTGGYHRDGYHWDLGQLILEGLGPGEQAGKVLDELGLRDAIRLIPADRVYAFPDFTIKPPDEYGGTWWRRDFFIDEFPQERRGIESYYRYYRRMMEVVSLARRAEVATGAAALRSKLLMYAKLLPLISKSKWSASRLLDHLFESERIKAAFTSILADFVVRPEEFQGLGVAFVNPEPAFDKRVPVEFSRFGRQPSYVYIDGGCRALIDLLADVVRKHGGGIHTGCQVTAIRTQERRVTGVELADGSFEAADVVVATGGGKEFARLLAPGELDERYREIVEGLPLMESAFMLQLGLDIDPAPYLDSGVNYFYLTYDISGAVGRIEGGRYHEGEDGFVIANPSLFSPRSAPPGRYAITIYTVAPDTPTDFAWADARETMAERLLDLAGERIPDLKRHIVKMEILTPVDFRRITGLAHHSLGGCAPVMGRPTTPHRTSVEGLWFAGAQSESGAGINNVMEGAWRVARMIRADT